jgi:hypothetical protein
VSLPIRGFKPVGPVLKKKSRLRVCGVPDPTDNNNPYKQYKDTPPYLCGAL